MQDVPEDGPSFPAILDQMKFKKSICPYAAQGRLLLLRIVHVNMSSKQVFTQEYVSLMLWISTRKQQQKTHVTMSAAPHRFSLSPPTADDLFCMHYTTFSDFLWPSN